MEKLRVVKRVDFDNGDDWNDDLKVTYEDSEEPEASDETKTLGEPSPDKKSKKKDPKSTNGKAKAKDDGKPKWTVVCAKAMRDNEVSPPLFSKLARGMDKKKVTFMIYARQWAELVAIKERFPGRYKNDSDICRQFMQNAIELHIERLKDVPVEKIFDDGLGDSLRKATEILDKQYARQVKRRLSLEVLQKLHEQVLKGEMEQEDMDEAANEIIGGLPNDLRKVSLQDFRRLKAGEKVQNIMDFFEAHGG